MNRSFPDDDQAEDDEGPEDDGPEEEPDPTGFSTSEHRQEYAHQLYKRAHKFEIPASVLEQSKCWTYLRPLLLHCAVKRSLPSISMEDLLYDGDGDDPHGQWTVVFKNLQAFLNCLEQGSYLSKKQAEAMDLKMTLPLMIERELYLYLRDWMLPHYQRRTRGDDTTDKSSANMIEQTIQGGQKIANLENADLLYHVGKRREEKSLRSHRVTLIKTTVQLATSATRRLTYQDPTVGTAAQTINSDKVKTMAEYVLRTGDVTSIRCFCCLLVCFACCLRHITLEKAVQPNLFLELLGDRAFEAAGQRTYEMAALVIDKSKENLLGHKQVTGAIHARNLFICPLWYLSCYMCFIKFVVWRQQYPDFDDDSSWMEVPLIQTESKINTNEGMSDKEIREDYHLLYSNALKIGKEEIAQLPQRHGGRHFSVLQMCKGGVPSLDQNEMGMWGDLHSRRSSNYAWNTITSSAALTLAGTPYNVSTQHECPYRKIDVSDTLASFYDDRPFKWAQRWRDGARPKKHCCMAFNALMIMQIKTFIQGLPIILRRYSQEIAENPDHIFNHQSIIRLTESAEYKTFAQLQLEAYDAAILPVAQGQANLDSIASAQRGQAMNMELLLRQHSQRLTNHAHLEDKLDKIASDIEKLSDKIAQLSTSTLTINSDTTSGPEARIPVNDGSVEICTSSSRAPQNQHSSSTCSRRVVMQADSISSCASPGDLFAYDKAVEYLPSLEELNRKTSDGRQYGMQRIVTAYLVGNKQKDGMTPYPPLQYMDETYGLSWVSQIKKPEPKLGVKSANLLNRVNEVRTIFQYIKSKIPSNASGPLIENALEQAKLLDLSRSKRVTLSSWWESYQCNQTQKKKAKLLEERVRKDTILTDKERAHLISMVKTVHDLVDAGETTERSNKAEGSRTLKPALVAMKKAAKQYQEYLNVHGAPSLEENVGGTKQRKRSHKVMEEASSEGSITVTPTRAATGTSTPETQQKRHKKSSPGNMETNCQRDRPIAVSTVTSASLSKAQGKRSPKRQENPRRRRLGNDFEADTRNTSEGIATQSSAAPTHVLQSQSQSQMDQTAALSRLAAAAAAATAAEQQ